MSSASKVWIVATSIGVVEALKDQGVCRWNGVLRSLQQRAKNNIRSFYTAIQAMKASTSSSSSSSASTNNISTKIAKRRREEVQMKVMELNCWGPSTVKF